MIDIHHHKICMGVDWFQHAGHGLVKELLACVGITFGKVSGAFLIVQRCHRRP